MARSGAHRTHRKGCQVSFCEDARRRGTRVLRRQAVCPRAQRKARLWRAAPQTSGPFRCGGSSRLRHDSCVVGSGFPEIGDTRRHHARIVVIGAEPGVALAAEQPAHPAGGVGMIDAKRLLWRLPADAAHAALLCQQAFVLFPGDPVEAREPAPKIRQLFRPASAPLALLDLLLVDRVIGAMLRLTPLSMFQVFRIALPSLCIPSTSVASQCHFPQSSRPVGPDLAIKRHAPTTGGYPAPLQIGARGNRFLRMARDQRAPPDRHAAQPVTARFMRTCRRNVSTRRQAQNHRSPAHPTKTFRPGMLKP